MSSGSRLGAIGALAVLAGSYVGLVLALVMVAYGSGLDGYLSAVVLFATPVWTAAMLLLGLPAAWWIERRLPDRPRPLAPAGTRPGDRDADGRTGW